MDNVILKTKKLIEVFETSELIQNLDYYKNRVINNNEIMNMINKYNNSNDEYEKMDIKKDIYNYDDYNLYMKYYNELFYYVMRINAIFISFTNERGCSSESH